MHSLLKFFHSLRKRSAEKAPSGAPAASAPAVHADATRVARLELDCRRALEDGDSAAAERSCRELLAQQPDHREGLSMLGNLLVHRGELEEVADCFSAAEPATPTDPRVTRIYRHERMDIEQVVRGIPYCREFADVLVDTSYWTVMQGDAVYSHDTLGKNLATSPFVRGRVSGDGSRIIASYPPPRTTIDSACLLVGGDSNYSHWLFRNLLKLCAAEREGRLYERPWLLNRDLMPWQEEYLDMLGLQESQRLHVERGQVIGCRNVLVPGLLVSKKMIAQGIQWLHGRLAAFMTSPADASRRIFVSRGDAQQRRLLNEDLLFARLEALGFERVVPGMLSVAAQIREFSSARVVVGVHGAGMTNILYAPPGSAIVEINSSAKAHMVDFQRIAGGAGHRIETVLSDDYPPHALPVHGDSDFTVDIDQVLEALGAATAGEIRARA